MKIKRNHERSRPIYREHSGRIVSYVVERTATAVSLGVSNLRLPTSTQVYVIDESGVRILSRNRSAFWAIALIMLVFALLASNRLSRRVTERTAEQ